MTDRGREGQRRNRRVEFVMAHLTIRGEGRDSGRQVKCGGAVGREMEENDGGEKFSEKIESTGK